MHTMEQQNIQIMILTPGNKPGVNGIANETKLKIL
jgi:hypothetical protein